MKTGQIDEYEKARQHTYEPLSERVPAERRDNLFTYTISCGSGWKNIVFNLVAEMDKLWTGYMRKNGREAWKLLQLKEKFGGLVFHVKYPESEDSDAKARREQSYAAIDFAEKQAWKTCERCGKPGHTMSFHYYIATVCDDCEKRWKERSAKGMIPTLFG